jgi:hypothetical protein
MDRSKLLAFEEQLIVSMYAVLPLAIAQAFEDSNSRFYSVINRFPDLLEYISKIKSYNDTFKHSTKESSITSDTVINLNSIAVEIIQLLLPNFKINTSFNSNANYLDNVSQKKINAEVSLSDELGWDTFYNLDAGVKNQLITISPDKKKFELPPTTNYIVVLSSVLETLLVNANKALYGIDTPRTKLEALNIIDLKFNTKLSENIVFNTVQDKFYNKALNEKSTTLGAIAIVYLSKIAISNNSNTLNAIKDLQFIDTIQKLIELRGHGNNINLIVDDVELNQLRKKVFDIIKFI